MQRKRLSKDDLVDRIRDGLDKKGWEITKRAPRAMVDEMAEVASTELVECGEFAVPRARTPTDRTAPATAGTEPGNRRANHDPRAEGDQGAAGQEPPRPGRRTGLAGRGRANPAELKRARCAAGLDSPRNQNTPRPDYSTAAADATVTTTRRNGAQ